MSSNGTIFIDTCVYIYTTKLSFYDSLKTCSGNNQRLINFPNATYTSATTNLNLNKSLWYWIGILRMNYTATLNDFYWIAGNTTYNVIQNNFGSMQSINICFLLRYNNGWFWAGAISSICNSSSMPFICQQPLTGEEVPLIQPNCTE